MALRGDYRQSILYYIHLCLCITEHAAYVEKETGQSGPTYQVPNTIERQQAPTGDFYAVPDKKSTGSRRQPLAAPTGALYTIPDKKPAKQVCSSLRQAF